MKRLPKFFIMMMSMFLVGGCSLFKGSEPETKKEPIGTYDETVVANVKGYWQGTYIANQGKTALLMNLKTVDEYGIVDGDFIFQYGAKKGSYKMRGVINFNNNSIAFSGLSWYVQPDKNYMFLDFTTSLASDFKTLSSDSTNYSMNLVKQAANFPDKEHYAALLKSDWNGTYIQNKGLSDLRLEIQSVDVETGNVVAIFHFIFEKDSVVGSYRMSGTFNFETHVLTLKGIEWISQPKNYVMLDFFVILNQGRDRLIGDESNHTVLLTKSA